ncbi:MAG: NERD domain-containing protein [Clostridia bacterium]|nr:NERD domain-containing protein [Clostridia bacterium]
MGLITYLLCSSVGSVGDRATAAKILQYGKDSEYYIYDICCAVQSSETVFRDLPLPVEGENGVYYIKIDVVAVNRGGVAVMKVNNNHGQIINPRVGNWIQRHKSKFLKFRNPFEQNDGNISILTEELKKSGFKKKIPIKNLVVFTDDEVKFNERYASLLTASDVAPFLRNMNEYRSLTKKEVAEVCAIFEKYRRAYRARMKKKKQSRRKA